MAEQAPARQLIGQALRTAFPALVICAVGLCTAALTLADVGQELNPRPRSDFGYQGLLGAGTALLTFIVLLGVKPRSWRTLLPAILWPPLVGLVTWMCTWTMLDQLSEMADFRHGATLQGVRELQIRSAQISRGRGVSYSVTLLDYPNVFNIDREEYRAVFGDEERVQPSEYCVRVTLQKAGDAVRVLADGGQSLPRGSLVRCDWDPKILIR